MFLMKKHCLFFHVKKMKGVNIMCQLIENFKMSLIEDGKRPKTIESYIGDIKAFIYHLRNDEE